MKNFTKYMMAIVTTILAFTYIAVTFLYNNSNADQLSKIINAGLLFLITISFIIYYLKTKKLNLLITFMNILLIVFLFINILTTTKFFNIPEKAALKDFANTNISSVINYAKKYNIKTNIIYEFSDHIPEYEVMSQDIKAGTLLSKVKNLTLIVSEGPDENKAIIVPSMLGWNTDRVIKYVTENFMKNVKVEFISSAEVKNTVIAQSSNGELKRNTELSLQFSQGENFEYVPVEMVDLKAKTFFEATMWAKMNGINIDAELAFNDDLKGTVSLKNKDGKNLDILSIKKGLVLNQKQDIGTLIENAKINLVVSKGNKVIIPDLKSMSIEEITDFVIKNKLKINYQDKYDDTVAMGKIISCNLNEGDVVEQGTLVTILSSKGQLKMEKFDSLEAFRNWASKYSIPISEVHEGNTEIPEGQIIKFSHNENDILSNGATVTVYISKGAPVIVPNLIGKSKSAIVSECRNAGLTYGFTYSSFNNAAKDTSLKQSLAAGSKVDKGTKIIITLSAGPGVSIPNLIGKDRNAAASICSGLGLSVNFVTGGYSNTPANCVTNQNIGAGTKVKPGTNITVTLSKGQANSQDVYLQPQWITAGNAQTTANNITARLKSIYSDLTVRINYVATNEPSKTGLLAQNPNIRITQGSTITISIYL
ncbi:MAG: PASTA domain-containing protein [Clostridia bacterium]